MFPILPWLISLESILIIGVTKLEALVINTSSALYNSFFVKLISFNISWFLFIIFFNVSLVMPLSISELDGCVINLLFLTIHTLEQVASVILLLSTNIAS